MCAKKRLPEVGREDVLHRVFALEKVLPETEKIFRNTFLAFDDKKWAKPNSFRLLTVIEISWEKAHADSLRADVLLL